MRRAARGIAYDLLLGTLFSFGVIVGIIGLGLGPAAFGLTSEGILISAVLGVLAAIVSLFFDYFALGTKFLLRGEMLEALPRYEPAITLRRVFGALLLFPLTEELFYRGTIQAGSTAYLGGASILVGGSLYLVHHYLNPVTRGHFVSLRENISLWYKAFITGIVLLVTNSLVGCVIAHAMMNLIYAWMQIKKTLFYNQKLETP